MNIFELTDKCRSNLNEFIFEVFDEISKKNGMTMLDIGCGSGVSSIGIKNIYDINITAVDIDEEALKVFKGKTDDIEILKGSYEAVKGRTFDIVLAEGLFNVIGFSEGMKSMNDVLKKGGFLLIHDDLEEVDKKAEILKTLGYETVKTKVLDKRIWSE